MNNYFCLIMACTASVFLLLHSSLSYSSDVLAILPGTENGCKENGIRHCCTGFYEFNDTCHECVGSFGINCTSPCPEGWYGPRCKEQCSCPDSKCDDVHGCPGDFRVYEQKELEDSVFKSSPLEAPISSSSPDRSTISIYTSTSDDAPVLSDRSTATGVWEMFVKAIESLNGRQWLVISVIFVAVVLLTVLCIVIVKCIKIRKRDSTPREYCSYMDHLFQEQANSDGYSGMSVYHTLNENRIADIDSKPTENVYMEI
ncbi:uncharacterized protein LOC125679901 isoform X2 [Ostrea edulis]|uniref:uncharacterized protein LOC125679901 isoform X2 n=1 Tax=Ostrea edulis TaxID=37623 RepID=UPI002094D767|nr:uncharacterized protein LOC125679901 isoform X2 [Ostrea edulis]